MHANLGRILGIWPHPDDFATNAAAFTRRAMRSGSEVTNLILTDGGAGWRDDRWPQDKLPEIRRTEELTSSDLLGITDVRFAGMPDAMNLDAHWVVKEIDTAISDIDPDSVITFGRRGLTGHPAHSDAYRFTRAVLRSPRHRPRHRQLITVAQSHRWLTNAKPLLADAAAAIFAGVLEQSTIDDPPDFEIELTDGERKLKRAGVMAHESQMVPLLEDLEEEGRVEQVVRNWFWFEAFHSELIA